jgi:hypothetical protein
MKGEKESLGEVSWRKFLLMEELKHDDGFMTDKDILTSIKSRVCEGGRYVFKSYDEGINDHKYESSHSENVSVDVETLSEKFHIYRINQYLDETVSLELQFRGKSQLGRFVWNLCCFGTFGFLALFGFWFPWLKARCTTVLVPKAKDLKLSSFVFVTVCAGSKFQMFLIFFFPSS